MDPDVDNECETDDEDADDWDINDLDKHDEGEYAVHTYDLSDLYCIEDFDDIDPELDEFISDEIMFRGGNPYDFDTRNEFLSDPFHFGDDTDDDW